MWLAQGVTSEINDGNDKREGSHSYYNSSFFLHFKFRCHFSRYLKAPGEVHISDLKNSNKNQSQSSSKKNAIYCQAFFFVKSSQSQRYSPNRPNIDIAPSTSLIFKKGVQHTRDRGVKSMPAWEEILPRTLYNLVVNPNTSHTQSASKQVAKGSHICKYL